ncbi:MAG: response regulator [Verrucomicrobia bacterium]|nr:response regulator [Verrucomicrobiota bacterium]
MKQHILVIDDEGSIRELLGTFFQARGYRVSSASTAAEALRVVEDTLPDVVLLDLLLPDADGLELLENFKQTHPDLPVIIMTGMGSDESLLKEARTKGAAGYVSKTDPLDKLLREVELQFPSM